MNVIITQYPLSIFPKKSRPDNIGTAFNSVKSNYNVFMTKNSIR